MLVRSTLAISRFGPALLRCSTGSRRCTLGQKLTAVQLGCAGAPALYRSILSGDASQQRLEYLAHLVAPVLGVFLDVHLRVCFLRRLFWRSAPPALSCGARRSPRSSCSSTERLRRLALHSNLPFWRLAAPVLSRSARSSLPSTALIFSRSDAWQPWRLAALALVNPSRGA